MSHRDCTRLPVNIEAEFISGNVSFAAFIKNISMRGIHARIAHTDKLALVLPKTNVDLKLQLLGFSINLKCIKKWSSKNTDSSFIENIGVEIINPPPEYVKFYQIMSRYSLAR